MAQEIEHYLMEQFENVLDGNDKSISKIPRYSQFQAIKTVLKEIFRSSSSLVDQPLRDKLYNLNNALTECQILSRKHGFYSPEELLTINRIRMELKQIKKELKTILGNSNRGSNRNIDEQVVSNVDSISSKDIEPFRWPTRSVDASKVYGFDDDVLSMEKLLVQQESRDRFKAIGVVGREGIGKTTLCQLVFNKPEVKNNFLPRIWVCMARDPDGHEGEDLKVAIVKRMLVYLGVGKETVKSIFDEKHGLEGLLCALYQQLVGKRYLIVLDDAKETDSWYGQLDSCLSRDKKWDDGFAFGFPKGHGGRVIATSRNEEVAKMMVGEKNIHHLLPLSDPDICWAIFEDTVEDSRVEDEDDRVEVDRALLNASNLDDLKLEIKLKCGGLPLAAKMMGQAMRTDRRINLSEFVFDLH
ncbi:PREDICTED: disease resistance [Prunus dulcis]|uniref:PREDICTED: disease resistance n=1 Tax=Prunus dulcis TaxID=3755 RepID=A0A5E4FCU8_PRUDU|nr:probable disease resistance protein At5g45440 [Prunus dulcis]VVA24929.1 PREDICTED: disease resistance [Prunus dulcis]